MGSDDLATKIKNSFKDMWCDRLLAYAKKNKKFSKELEGLSNAIDSGCEEQGEVSVVFQRMVSIRSIEKNVFMILIY
jgi:hypothetical protein